MNFGIIILNQSIRTMQNYDYSTEDFYEDIVDNVEKRFDTLIYEVNRPL